MATGWSCSHRTVDLVCSHSALPRLPVSLACLTGSMRKLVRVLSVR